MFKEIKSSLMKFFTTQRIIIFIILIVLGFALFSYSNSKSMILDQMEDGSSSSSSPENNAPSNQSTQLQAAAKNIIVPNTNSIYNLQTVANPSDLLPQDKNSQWGTLNPSLSPNNVVIPDLLEAGYTVGISTIGNTLRNANQQIRSDPIIPKKIVSPWLNSDIEPNIGSVPLEIGSSCR